MRTIAVIPARMQSTRLPGKMLADIHGHPLIWHVWQRVMQARQIQRVLIATDSEQIQTAAQALGAEVVLTSPDCRSGTERIASILDQIDADFVLNVQGDEPLIDPALLDALIERWQITQCEMITPVFRIQNTEELRSPNIVKVARAASGQALYFSRSPVPFFRDAPIEEWLQHCTYWGHTGVYGYRRDVLEHYSAMPESALEHIERLEQLRFLEAGVSIMTMEAAYRSIGVDVQPDLDHVRAILAEKRGKGNE